MQPLVNNLVIDVGARKSALSQAQVREVLVELNRWHPHVIFRSHFTDTQGDLDQKTSLRTLDRTNFFTKEVDELVISGKCRIGIHSAKDLPHPLPEGLAIAALTSGVDESDSLVMRPGDRIETLKEGAIIATSSARREETVRQLRSDLQFIDLRGNIGQRLNLLQIGKADGVVVAEAALIRLKLTNLNRIRLPGTTAQYQGQLAILVREEDLEMLELFAPLDTRPRVLYLGTEAPQKDPYRIFTHCPFIQVIPRMQNSFEDLEAHTHILFSSKNAVDIFFEQLKTKSLLEGKEIWAVGKATAERIHSYQVQVTQVASEEMLEGFISLLEREDTSNAFVYWPHSSLSRSVLIDYMNTKKIRHTDCVLYDTKPLKPATLPNLKDFDEIVFTSPSTVDAFIEFYGKLPRNKTLTPIGPITKEALAKCSQ